MEHSLKVDFATSTANGMYFSFGNGYRIGWEYVTKTIPAGTKWENVYYADVDLGNWDIPFETAPRVWVSSSVNQYWHGGGFAYVSTTKRPTVRMFRPTSASSSNAPFNIFYMGR